MSILKKSTVACPKCGNMMQFGKFDSVTTTLNPEVKQRILSGEFGKVVCDKCGAISYVQYNFLFHDPEKAYMIAVGSDFSDTMKTMPVPENYRFRLVRDYLELGEKIRIFDTGLDDVVIEGVKWLISSKRKDKCKLFFLGWKDVGWQFVVGGAVTTGITISSKAYDLMAEYCNVVKVPQGCFAVVDSDYIRGVLGEPTDATSF